MFATNLPGISADGGIGSYVVALAKEFAARGNDVHVIGQHDKGCKKVDGYTLWLDPMTYIPVFERLLPGLGAMLALNRIVRQIDRQSKIDIIEFPNFEGTGLSAAAAGCAAKAPPPAPPHLFREVLRSLPLASIGLVPGHVR
jgi:hypothetical protein